MAFVAETVWTPEGWQDEVRIRVDETGTITAVAPAGAPEPDDVRLSGWTLPGMANLHSHAFQRALSGRTEHRGPGSADDSFWTWREAMYGLALTLSPDEVEAIAVQLFTEMLRSGFTAVGEFHYLHHAPDGSRYDDPAEMAARIASAAERTGIALTLMPVLYLTGGFGRPATARQRRFVCRDVDELLDITERARRALADVPHARIGLAPHSLRAVPPEALAEALTGLDGLDPTAPVHVHIAEQPAEVQDCLQHLGARPVDWLFDHADVDARWCLVHATHMTPAERDRLAASGAVAGLCPTTEANLGDGIFDAVPYLAAGGRFGIGTDSHASVGVTEELRWLEYAQRLTRGDRNALATETEPHVGTRLMQAALSGGAQALGQPMGAIAPGHRADLVVVDADHPRLAGLPTAMRWDGYVFGDGARGVREVWVGGRRVV